MEISKAQTFSLASNHPNSIRWVATQLELSNNYIIMFIDTKEHDARNSVIHKLVLIYGWWICCRCTWWTMDWPIATDQKANTKTTRKILADNTTEL